jgi:hypothetical protein
MLQLGSEMVLDATRPEADPDEPRWASTSLSTAELAECTCPDFCERDHDRD